MKNLILGLILGFCLSLPISAIAYGSAYTDWENEILYLLADIVDNGDEVRDKLNTIIDKL